MQRFYAQAHQRLAALRRQAVSEDGVTVPEYMLVLGFISVAVLVAFIVGDVTTAINDLTAVLADYIQP